MSETKININMMS